MLANVIAFVTAHMVVLASLGIAVLDLVFALIPNWASNGVLHWIYLWMKGKTGAPNA